jgi:hypothetical protein
MEIVSLSDVLISLIPIYGPWIIFGIVALESAGVPKSVFFAKKNRRRVGA